MAVLIANNARSALVGAIGALDTSITITSGTETLFPTPTGSDYFYVTIESSDKTTREIVKCTAKSSNVLTIVRAQDGTTANIFAAGSVVELRINRASLTDSIGAASYYATAAANSAATASDWANVSSVQALLASGSATDALTSETNAAASATAAAASATAANNSAVAAAAAAASGLYRQVLDKSANYTIVAADQGTLFRVNTGSGAITFTLPLISSVSDGFKVSVVKWTADANAVNINRSGSDTINGGTTTQIGSQYSQIIFVADFETNTWFASQSGLGATNVNIDPFSGNGSTTAFTLSADPSTKNNTNVYISGVYQAKSTYSVSGTTLTFSVAPPTGTNNIEVEYATPLAIGTPSDLTVSTAKLVDGSVTAAKMASGAAASNLGFTPVNKAGDTLTGALNENTLATIASASSIDIGAATANTISITGTTAITALGTIAAGAVRRLVFAGALTLTHNTTSLILPSGASITTAAGDIAEFVSLGSGNWRCFNYMKANGQAVVAPAAGVTSVATGNGLSGGTITSSGTLVIAAPSYNSVGSYVFGQIVTASGVTSGSTYSAGNGTNQVQATGSYSYSAQYTSNNLSGTWRLMGASAGTPPGGCANYYNSLFCRVA